MDLIPYFPKTCCQTYIFALKSYADLLRKMGRDAEAESYEARLKHGQANHARVNGEN